jgi:hypothetical protein
VHGRRAGAAATLATLVVSSGATVAGGPGAWVPTAAADPPSSTAPTSTSPTSSATASVSSAPLATDDRGFLSSSARCDGGHYAVAIGRTQRSLVVICTDPGGAFEYRGVRISDGAALDLPAESDGAGGFLAQNADLSYAVSPKQLLVTSAGAVVNREPMLDYQEPHLAAEAPPSQQVSPTTTTPTTVAAAPGG